MIEIPEKLYKYQSFSLNTLMNLKSHSLYFGSPNEFNDPYDCAIITSLDDPTLSDIEIIRQHELNNKETPSKHLITLGELDSQELKRIWMKNAKKAILDIKDKYFNNMGVTCFSELKDDLAMWAHYGGKYKGFCLEFDTNRTTFERVQQVKYVERMPSLNLVRLMLEDDDQILQTLNCRKSIVWEYEKEWRIFHEHAGTKYTYEPEELTAIYFGPDIEPQALDIICLIMNIQNPRVEFYEGKRSDREFKVEFTKAEYTPYSEVKRA